MPYPRFQRARNFKFASRSSGDLTVSSTSFTAVDTALDHVIEAQAGDVLEIGLQALWGGQAFYGRLRAVTVVGSTVTSQTFGDGTTGNAAWLGTNTGFVGVGGSLMYQVVSGDVSNGTVKVRLEVRVDSGTKTLASSTASPVHFWVKNLGPQQPY